MNSFDFLYVLFAVGYTRCLTAAANRLAFSAEDADAFIIKSGAFHKGLTSHFEPVRGREKSQGEERSIPFLALDAPGFWNLSISQTITDKTSGQRAAGMLSFRSSQRRHGGD